uniref:Osteoclastosis associated transmembrane protein 1 n=1 Tax=Scleropages formosus TaxID=113540 RepID=A0A8D0CCA5_SCLFO
MRKKERRNKGGIKLSITPLAAQSSAMVSLHLVPRLIALLLLLPGRIRSSSPVFNSLLSDLQGDPELEERCRDLLRDFGRRYESYVKCAVPSARPVRICENCHIQFEMLRVVYNNISSDQADPENCRDSLLRADRLMLVYMLFQNLEDVWDVAHCSRGYHGLSNITLRYMAKLNQSLSCFESQKNNHSELCRVCRADYKDLNEFYSIMEKNQTLCIDIEDSMNATRRLWSKDFNCSFPREETVPVIAVSSFMLFLPIIFYLSSFLHSEQKKRRLIHPKRAKSNNSLMNIQDKHS